MGKMGIENNIFAENYCGVLTHEGTIKVAKTNITAKILHISKNTVLVRGRKSNGYHTEIHKDLYSMMNYVEKGDTAFIKWKSGKPWFVGFKKNKKPFDVENENRSLDSDSNITLDAYSNSMEVKR